MAFTIGLTGGIGSGKSAVAAKFVERGIEVIDADALAHEMTSPGGLAIAMIREAFGQEFITQHGALDRVRITTVGGTDTFDAGSINIMYE